MIELMKAYKVEDSPYKSINGYIDYLESYTHTTTMILFSEVSKVLGLTAQKAEPTHPDAPLIFKGKIIYNPKTGQPVKMKEWRRLEEAIIKFLKIERKQLEKKIATDSYWLGTLLKRMSVEQRKNTAIDKIDISTPHNFESMQYTESDTARVELAEQTAGVYIQNVSDKARGQIQSVLTEGIRGYQPNHIVQQNLWDKVDDINRDWDRVVRTETARNANDAFLISTLRTSEEEYTFLKGISGANACRHCMRLINDQIVVLLANPPKGGGDKIKIDGVEYSAIWPGKSNVGRSVKDYWVCSIIHPYCRCGWTEWDLALEKYLKGD